MENAVEALKTAAAVLIFIIAITISFTMFSKAKATTDSIVKMQDKQAYLESDEVDNGILYTSSTLIGESQDEGSNNSKIPGMTIEGYRIVDFNDVISVLYRYATEKYGITIVKDNKAVARFDSNTEALVNRHIETELSNHSENLKKIIRDGKYINNITIDLKDMYKVSGENVYEAPWGGDYSEVRKRIACDITGDDYTNNGTKSIYHGKNLEQYKNNKFIEIVRQKDNNKYVKDENNNDTTLVQTSEMPTIEIVYIIQ